MARFTLLFGLLLFGVGCATTGTTEDSSGKKTAKASSKEIEKRAKRAGQAKSSSVPKSYKKRETACHNYRATIEKVARKYDLEPELVMGVVKVESSFNPKCKSRVGARGLMQVMPRTGKHLKCDSDLHDPEANIECGCRVLKRYLDLYDGNVIYGLSAYNAGPGNSNPSAKGKYLPFNFAYVEKVLRWRNVFVRFGCR
jgi:soluble lytic murein transglycosylase-like protein